MEKSTKIIIKAGTGMIDLTNNIWKNKYSQLIKNGKLEKKFGDHFLEKLESKVKKKQKQYDSFIKAITKSYKKSKSKKNPPVSKKTIVEFTLETFGKTNEVWAKSLEQLIKDGKLAKEEGKNLIKKIDQQGKQQCEAYLKDMADVISSSLAKDKKKKTVNSPKKTIESIIGMIGIARASWKKSQAAKEEPKKEKKKKKEKKQQKVKKQQKFDLLIANVNKQVDVLQSHQKRIHDLELKVGFLEQEINAIKESHQESEIEEIVIQEVIEEKATPTEAIIITEKDNFKKIEGIGPKIESLLHDAGILTFSQLSSAQSENIKAILIEAGNRFKMHNPTNWGQQAALAAKGNWEALKKWQEEVKSKK